jgi:hypothetical protein
MLYVRAYYLTKEQLSFVLNKSMELASTKLGREIKSDYLINRVLNREGKYMNHCLVWIHNSEFFNLLTGKNADGTERVVKRVISPAPLKPIQSPIQVMKSPAQLKKMSWADIDEEEEKAKVAMSPKTVIEKIGPVFEIPVYEYTPEQLELMAGQDNEVQSPKTPDVKDVKSPVSKAVTGVKTGKLTFLPAEVKQDRRFSSNQIKSVIPIPAWITVDDLRKVFDLYYTGPRMSAMMLASNKNRRDGQQIDQYPNIIITSKRFALINYKPGTTDALFAVAMSKVTTFTNSKTGEKVAITFSSVLSEAPKKKY